MTEGCCVDVGFALLADSEADTDREQLSDLDRLECWLVAAEAALSSLRCHPQLLTKFDEAVALHKVGVLKYNIFVIIYIACALEIEW